MSGAPDDSRDAEPRRDGARPAGRPSDEPPSDAPLGEGSPNAGPPIEGPRTADAKPDEPPPVRLRSYRRLWRIAHPHRGLLFGATALLGLMSLGGLAVPKLAGDVVDVALEGADSARLRWIVGGMVGLFAFIGVIGFLESWMLGLARARIQADLRRQLFGHLLRLSAAFYDKRRVGELLSRLSSDLGVIEGSLTTQIPFGLQALLRFIGTIVVLFVLQPKLTLVALLVVPPIVLLAMFVGNRVEKLSTGVRDATADSTALADEVLVGLRTVQAADAGGALRGRYDGTVGAIYDVQVKSVRIESIFAGAVTFAGFSAFALVLGYGGELMLAKELTPGELMTFLLYTFSIAMSVGQLGGLYTSLRDLAGASKRMFEILDTVPEVEDPGEADPPPAPYDPRVRNDGTQQGGAPRVAFEDLRFTYEEATEPAIDGVSFEAEPGSTVALVGPSGSGKSTLFALLLRFYDPSEGAVRLDGRDVRSMSLGDLRRSIGYVPQEVFLFSGTIADNLRLGRADASEDELRGALEAAGALEFVDGLEKGLGTEIGERGLRLSGGQRQRLAIARAFVEDPALLLLDEATSALDPDSEAIVQGALGRLFRGRTTFVIAHRLATARRADVIYVLEGGRVQDRGTHDELIESNELYRRYWTLQSLETRGDGLGSAETADAAGSG
ncbi:MAG: ABC transporter transmembrane domain-containing protein [Planctomycetota bacterium]